jgi:hypothetical protein
MGLGQRRGRFLKIGFGDSDVGRIPLRKIHNCRQRDLRR